MHTRLQILIPLQRHFLMHCFLRKVSQARRGGTHFRTRKKGSIFKYCSFENGTRILLQLDLFSACA